MLTNGRACPIVQSVAPISKKELADALDRMPLGAQSNRIKVALAITGDAHQVVARDTGIHFTRFSKIANGFLPASPDERRLIAKRIGVPERVLFPEREVA